MPRKFLRLNVATVSVPNIRYTQCIHVTWTKNPAFEDGPKLSQGSPMENLPRPEAIMTPEGAPKRICICLERGHETALEHLFSDQVKSRGTWTSRSVQTTSGRVSISTISEVVRSCRWTPYFNAEGCGDEIRTKVANDDTVAQTRRCLRYLRLNRSPQERAAGPKPGPALPERPGMRTASNKLGILDPVPQHDVRQAPYCASSSVAK